MKFAIRSNPILSVAVCAPLLAGFAIVFSPGSARAGDNLDHESGGVIFDGFWDARLYSGSGGFPNAVEWSHDPALKPAGVDKAEFEQVVEGAFDDWEAVDSLAPKFQQGPDAASVCVNPDPSTLNSLCIDGVHLVEWSNQLGGAAAFTPCWVLTEATQTTDDGNGNALMPISGAPAIPFPGPPGQVFPKGTMIDCGIIFDAATSWSTTPGLFDLDLETVAKHEIGHFIGLSHASVGVDQPVSPTSPTMRPVGEFGNTDMRSLEEDDKASLLRTYARNAEPIVPQPTAGRGVIELTLRKSAACSPATGVAVWAYLSSEGPLGSTSVETFSGSQLRLGLGDEPFNGSVTLNVPPLASGDSYVIAARILEEGVGLYSSLRYNTTTINSNTVEAENQGRTFDNLATVTSLAAGETVDLGEIGFDNCWVAVSESGIDIVAGAATAPATAIIGSTISVTSSLSNQGVNPSGPFESGIYFSTDSTIDADDAYAEFSCTSPGLPAGGVGTCDGSVTVPGLPPGFYYVGILADRLNDVGESIETNNGVAAANQVEVMSNPLDPIVNGSFETGDFSGWGIKEINTASNPNKQLEVNVGGVDFPANDFPLVWCGPTIGYCVIDFFDSEPTDGTYVALHDFNGDDPATPEGTLVNRRELYQDVTLPASATTLEFDWRAAWEHFIYAVPSVGRTFSVEIQPAGGGSVLTGQTYLTTIPGGFEEDTDNPSGGTPPYPDGILDVSAHAGQDVRIVFVWNVPEPATGFGYFQLDNVRLNTSPNNPPVVVIGSPANGSSFTEGDNVSFTGTANDAEDGDLTASLAWSSNLDGAIGAGGSFSTAALSVGTHTITAAVTDSGGLDGTDAISLTITLPPPPPPIISNFGTNFSTARGTAGDASATQALDSAYQVLSEEVQGGNPRRARSLLDHTWVFNVASGTSYEFQLNAYRPPNGEGDDFLFQYSTDNSTFVDMLTVSKASDDGTVQTFPLPSNVAGAFYVRVQDTDDTRGNNTPDDLFVDYMVVVTVTDGSDVIAPMPPTGLAATPGDSIVTLDWADNGEADLAGYNVYRSTTSGGPYALLAGPLPSASSYVDATAINGIAYFYVVTAVDTSDNESANSDEASATPGGDPGGPSSIHVESVITSTVNAGQGNKRGRAVVRVVDDQGTPVAGASVAGQFSGTFGEAAGPASTGADGTVTFDTAATARGGVSVGFCISSVTGTLTYQPGDNGAGVASCSP